MPDPTLLGNVYPFSFTVKDDTGTAVTPATLTLTVTKPDGTDDTKVIAEFTNPTVGEYDLDYLPAAVGRYVWYQVTTEPNTSTQGWFDVIAAGTDLTYIDVNDLKNALAGTENLAGTAATLSDTDLADAIAEAQAEVDGRVVARGYTVPFTDPPDLIVTVTRDISAYLATLKYRRGEPIAANEPIALRYTRAEQLLAQVASGAITLQASAGGAEQNTPQAAVVNPVDGSLFTLDDFNIGVANVLYDPTGRFWPAQ